MLEVGPGPRLADPRPAAARPPTCTRSRSTRRWPAALPATVAERARLADRLTVHTGDALRDHRGRVRPGADRAGGQPAVQRRRAGGAAPARRAADAAAAAWSWCRRRSPTGSPPGPAAGCTASRSVKLAWYADAPPGRPGAAQRVLAGAQRGLRAGRVHPARAAARRRTAGRRSSRSSTPRSPSAARRCARPWPAGPAAPTRRPRCSSPAGVDPQAARRAARRRRSSPPSPPRRARRQRRE